jgi:hypothetical protein
MRRHPQSGCYSLLPGESPADFVSRFKDELKQRREHMLAGKRKDRVALTSMAQEKSLLASEAEEAHERKTRKGTLSASSIVSRIRSFSEAHKVMEAAAVVRSALVSNSRNLFAKSGPQGLSKESLARKYSAPKSARRDAMLQVRYFSVRLVSVFVPQFPFVFLCFSLAFIPPPPTPTHTHLAIRGGTLIVSPGGHPLRPLG